ncbi:von Willebrand factor A domain-containing protein 5B2 isoform X2 [Bufo gargarizans]|uniref:von Willebrand factor A domain-containing protein 5B2 isoform X2 n=1 Tax=Bufo gargarizans TaxID=30331 RepID=UPI001CF294D1|nr:von Willebrand factor A domain-containing protein 5B2 isoform X2 [Bufo gargarizans]
MPGLYDTSSWAQLPLETSCVNACANGFSLGLNAQLTYLNPCNDTVQAMFIYLLEEGEVVTSFEAVTGNRKVQAQVQNQIRMEECCSSCHWESLPCYCSSGHLVLDPDTAHRVFVLTLGSVLPSAVVSVALQSSKELQTLSGGAVRVTLNSTLTPMAPNPGDPSDRGDGLCDDSSASCFGGVSGTGVSPWMLLADSPPQTLTSMHPKSLSAALTGMATNPQRYHFSFRLQVQGPCLLAGIESPSHALRADASPFAVSASSIWISLAEEYNCDRALEIILHPSEPHLPHLSLEKGNKTFQQYETHIKERKDFIKGMKKSSDPERQVNFVRRRFHKDLHLNPVLMLNFCPDITALSSLSSNLPTVTREVIFLVHLMEEPCHNIRDALLLAVRSLPARTLLNVAGGTCDSRALFPTSRQCSNDSLEMACEFFQSNKMCGMSSNFPSVLGRILAHPVHRGYPRQVFIITDTGFTHSSRILELLRRHARTTRVFGFGLGSNVNPNILEKAAKLTRGTVELLSEGQRLQPKLVKSLKKALEPALSDITIDWYMPETMEALLTPNDIAPLYPGDSLISYCTLYNTASFRSKKGPTRVARGGSFSSVFQSQEESQTTGTTDTSYLNPSGMEEVERALQEISHEISMEFSAWSEDPERTESIGGDGAQVSDIRKRIVRSSYVQEQYMLTHCSVSTEPTQAPTQPSTCGDHTRATSHGSTSSESVGSRETVSGDCIMPCSKKVSQQGKKSISQSEGMWALLQNSTPSCKAKVTQSTEELIQRKALIQATMSGRSFSSPHGELDMLRLRTVLDKVSQSQDLEEVNARRTEGLCDSLTGQLPSTAQLDWDMLVDEQYLFSASPAAANMGSGVSSESGWQCRAVIHGYIGSSNHSWETSINLEPLLTGVEEDFGNSTESEYEKYYDLHQLAARSVIRDNEDMTWRECDIEHGSSRRFRLKAMQTSKSCSQVSLFTCHMPVDPDTQDALPGHMIVRRGGRSRRCGSSNSGSWSMADNRYSELMEDTFENAARSPVLPSSPPRISSENGFEKTAGQEGHIIGPLTSQKLSDSCLNTRVNAGKRKIRSLSGKLSPLKPCLTGDKEPTSELVVQDYLPLIKLQSPEGFFNLNSCFSSVVQISLQRLLRASPFTCHRGSLSPVSEPCPVEHGDFIGESQTCKGGSQPQVPMIKDTSPLPVYATSCPEALCHQADSGRGSETDPCDTSPCPSETGNELDTDLEGCSWATAVALAWLEHRCAGYFIEWELLAAKAEGWLRAQTLPDGLQLLALKGAARQLFLLLRHWDENLNLNILCYKPGDV